MIDPMSSLQKISDRITTQEILDTMLASPAFREALESFCQEKNHPCQPLLQPASVTVPAGLSPDTVVERVCGLTYPLLVKPAQSHGSHESHVLGVATSP